MSDGVVGGADGPTTIFLAGSTGPNWINLFGIMVVILLLIPNLMYAMKFRHEGHPRLNRGIYFWEQIGRYASMFLMAFPVWGAEAGFRSAGLFLAYGIGNAVMLVVYWLIWVLYFYRQDFWKSMALAVIPTGIFLVSGITLGNIFLVFSAVVFGVSHIYITYVDGLGREG